MKKIISAAVILVTLTVCAKIILYTDKPNAVPVDSDFFSLQRNSDYISASVAQVRGSWFNNPVFTGTVTGITNINFITVSSTTNINNFDFTTNLIVNNEFVTNITVEVPGGFTNLNLTPKTVMWADVNDAEGSIPNASGVLTNNGTGGIGFNNKIQLDEIDALNFFPTNFFTGLTNYSVLGTDSNGLLTLGSSTTNLTVTNLTVTTIYASTNFSTNLFFVSGKGNTLVITNNLNLQYLSASKLVATDGAKNLTNADVSANLSFSGNVLDIASTPTINLVNSTNLVYRYTTKALTAITMTFGKAYMTNVSANIVFTAVNAQDLAALETVCLFATNSGGTDRTITLPNGIGSPGLGLPPVITVTNKQSCWIYVQHYGNQATNCWFIPSY